MIFYEVRTTITNGYFVEKMTRREEARKVENEWRSLVYSFNRPERGIAVLPVVLEGDKLRLAVISERCEGVSDVCGDFLRLLHLECSQTTVREVTFREMHNLLQYSERHDYIEDDFDIMKMFELEKTFHTLRENGYPEDLISLPNPQELRPTAWEYLTYDSLHKELTRIGEGTKNRAVFGHPVHYLIETDDEETRDKTVEVLLNALYEEKRIGCRRFALFDTNDIFKPEALYHSLGKATAVVRVSENFGENGNYARQETAFLEDIAACCSQNRLDVLTVFCLPKECEKIKNLLYAKAEGVTFVEIKEEFATLARAKEFLKALAKKGGFKPDRKLYAKLKENEQYSTAGLRSIFSEWMNNNLKTSVYPQYKDFTDADRALATQAPSGLAIDELNAMIGLGGVKDTVARTIDFFNAQSLLRSHGVAVNKPMLHMVFTGNPGTAKTTVARLFGRILKDNGILSRDVFVEVGRGDLVGKYVGSTAPLVKDKFKAAEGGVLFIDEAYSLVDDRDGLYGDEAINTIVQEMENRRDSVCVIFAGYPDKMEKFLDKNPGLRSRVAAHIRFEDYSTEELLEIAKLLAKKQGLELTSGAAQNLTALFDEAREQKDFGNGRYVRNVLDRAKMTHSSRIVHSDLDALKPADYTLLTAQDIELPKASPKPKKICGFCA